MLQGGCQLVAPTTNWLTLAMLYIVNKAHNPPPWPTVPPTSKRRLESIPPNSRAPAPTQEFKPICLGRRAIVSLTILGSSAQISKTICSDFFIDSQGNNSGQGLLMPHFILQGIEDENLQLVQFNRSLLVTFPSKHSDTEPTLLFSRRARTFETLP